MPLSHSHTCIRPALLQYICLVLPPNSTCDCSCHLQGCCWPVWGLHLAVCACQQPEPNIPQVLLHNSGETQHRLQVK